MLAIQRQRQTIMLLRIIYVFVGLIQWVFLKIWLLTSRDDHPSIFLFTSYKHISRIHPHSSGQQIDKNKRGLTLCRWTFVSACANKLKCMLSCEYFRLFTLAYLYNWPHRRFKTMQHPVCFAGCGGKPATLVGSEGTFGISQTEYDNYLSCSWSIQVDTTKVTNSKQYFL